MSNEPKWTFISEEDAVYGIGHTFYIRGNLSAKKLCDTLNRLESENAELRERLNTIKAELNEVRECYQYSQAANKLTPRTDADGLRKCDICNMESDAGSTLFCCESCGADGYFAPPTPPATEGEQNG